MTESIYKQAVKERVLNGEDEREAKIATLKELQAVNKNIKDSDPDLNFQVSLFIVKEYMSL